MADNAPRMTQAQLLSSYEKPDWEALGEEIHCPLCGYNLRGLSEPMCPECGYRFAWRDLLDPTRRLHPYLFEHHPEHNIRSFLATVTRRFRPFTFWKSLRPDQPANPGRLKLYWLIVSLVAMLPVPVIWIFLVRQWYSFPFSGIGPFMFAWRNDWGRGITSACMAAAAWPALDWLTLLIFQQSMARAKVKSEHVLRCAIYSGDVAFWAGLAVTAVLLWTMFDGRSMSVAPFIVTLIVGSYIVGFVVHFARLVSAYRRYMQFHAPFATILASQVIAVLTWMVLMVIF